MCGRYVASRGAEELVAAFGVDVDSTAGALRPTFNAAPTSRQPVVRRAHDREGGGDGPDGPQQRRELVLAVWGLVPFFAREPTGGGRTINARVETVLDKPSYRRAVRTGRCLVPVDGWYEWTPGEGGARKQPWFMAPADGSPLALAGICETWRPKDDGAEPLLSFSVITRDAQEDLRAVHERMPLVLDADLHDDWLDAGLRATGDVADLLALARSRRAGVTRTPVGTAVGSVRSNGPELLVPVGPVLGG